MNTQDSHISSVKTLVSVFLALVALTVLTTGVSYIDLGAGSTFIAIAIAGTKATLVVWFFMNVRFNTRIIPLVILCGLGFLVILFSLTFVDYFSRGWFGYGR
ncbi:MAG: cytochrome C oxidase subunit IV family protein [Thermoanaerobaculia bacterium]